MTFDLLSLAGFFVALLGLLGTAWWRITVMVRAAADVATRARDELANHKLHVAESYVSKSGMRDIQEQIMDAIGGIGHQMTEMRGRIDRLLDKSAPRTTRA